MINCYGFVQSVAEIHKLTSEEIKNNFESKCSLKIETNSKGHNTTVHVYQGATKEDIDDTIKQTIYAHNELQTKLEGGKW